MRRVHVKVHGDVQGVFFRDTIEGEAGGHGVAGWVRSASDGTVEAVFEGEEEAVEQMIELCRAGPSAATVERVDVDDEEPEGASGFEVR